MLPNLFELVPAHRVFQTFFPAQDWTPLLNHVSMDEAKMFLAFFISLKLDTISQQHGLANCSHWLNHCLLPQCLDTQQCPLPPLPIDAVLTVSKSQKHFDIISVPSCSLGSLTQLSVQSWCDCVHALHCSIRDCVHALHCSNRGCGLSPVQVPCPQDKKR